MKEYKDIKESRIINLLVPEAITRNNQLHQEIKKRIKLNQIFTEFENKASNKFNYFINMSSQRYNSLKNGHKLHNLINNAREKNQIEANKILQDPFYSVLNLDKEKQKMKIIKTKDINKSITSILSKMKQPQTIDVDKLPNNINDDENIFFYEDNKNSMNSYKEYINRIINNDNINNNNNNDNLNKNYNSANKKSSLINIKKNRIKFKKELQPMNKNIIAISSIFKKEENMINKSFKNYENLVKTEASKDTSKKGIPMSGIAMRLPRLKLLNYKSQKNINKANENKDLNKHNIDYNYLLSFSDKSLYKNNQNYNYNTPEKESKNNCSFPLITEVDCHSTRIENYGNTSDMVVNSVKKEINKENDLDYKRKRLETIMGTEKTPKIHVYDEILKKKSETIKNERNRRARRLIEKQKYLKGTKKESLNLQIDNNIKLLDKVFKNIDKYNLNKRNQY